MSRFRRLLVGAAAAGATLMVAGPAVAQPAASPVGKKQYFAGQVNGNSGQSVLSVTGCSPTTTSNSDAHGNVLPGQTVSVIRFLVPPPTAVGSHLVGYTGSGHKISADLAVAFKDHPLVLLIHLADLTAYDTPAALPPGLSVPCDATFTALFSPVNGGAKGTASEVDLTLGHPAITIGHTVIMPPPKPTLNGTGFAPNTTYTVAECSQTNWIVPKNPCLKKNTITVTTDPTGAFTHSFRPAPCSNAMLSNATVSNAMASTCFVGVPLPSGIDTISLVGATPITVL